MSDIPPVCEVPSWQQKRCRKILECFLEKYKKKVDFFARASGRVNLIGEHIDYCGYAVLPMAIEQDIVIGFAVNAENILRISNTNPEYQDFACKSTEFHIKKGAPDWYDYILCGYKGIMDHCGLACPVGMDMVVCGTVPKSAGLSSSSALVCCAALASMQANSKTLTKVVLSEVTQHCEHLIGTEGGGMDQAISFLAQPGTAKLIEFNPLKTTDVCLPDGAVFVISNSCAEINKAATSHYNTRVAECRLACQVLAKHKNLNWKELKKLGDLQTKLGVSLSDMLSLVEQILHKDSYSKDEICEILGVTPEELNSISLSEKTYAVEKFHLYKRATHVYGEANRVWQFKGHCDNQSASSLQDLGQLMFDSHVSCKDMYECSCTELDQLVELARSSGALGSRLTGAGWGGCAVSLVPAEKVPSFLEAMKQGFYTGDRAKRVFEALFATQPGGGAAIYTPSNI